jgi:hypothetical protein
VYNLHFASNGANDTVDRAQKVQPIMNILLQGIQAAYRLGKYIVVDESLMP